MTPQEEKSLLLIDLSSRLLYGVKILRVYQDNEWDDLKMSAVEDLETIDIDDKDYYINDIKVCNVRDIKPYLRPMSSMTEEEKEELYHYYCNEIADNLNTPNLTWELRCCISNSFGTDWLNAHYFDYRGLIEKDLALEAPKGMYN